MGKITKTVQPKHKETMVCSFLARLPFFPLDPGLPMLTLPAVI